MHYITLHYIILHYITHYITLHYITLNYITLQGGSVAEWFRAPDLKSEGPLFKSSALLLSGFVLGSPEFNSSTALCK